MPEPNRLQRADVDHSIQDVVAMGSVLSKYRWARVWHSVNILTNHDEPGAYFEGSAGPTAAEIIEETGIPQTTVYEDLSTLLDLGALSKDNDGESSATKYQTNGGHLIVSSGIEDSDEDYLTPLTIGVVGKGYDEENVETFIERNGYNILHLCCLLVGGGLGGSEFDELSEVLPELDTADAHLIEDAILEIKDELAKETLYDQPGS